MSTSPTFEKVGECLYRNPSSGTYFARVKIRGKEIKQTLETDNLPIARRKLKEFKAKLERMDPTAGRITLAELADKFEKTIQHFARETISNKARVSQTGSRDMAMRRRPSCRKNQVERGRGVPFPIPRRRRIAIRRSKRFAPCSILPRPMA